MENHHFPWIKHDKLPFSIVRLIYQRVDPIKSHETTIFLWFSYGFPMVFLMLVIYQLDLHSAWLHLSAWLTPSSSRPTRSTTRA